MKRSLYFRENGVWSLVAPSSPTSANDSFVSDPAHPVPYRPRPIPSYVEWESWLVRDQRFVDNPPDVLTWQTAPLTADMTIAGDVAAKLFASTTGSDADWVVKLIDVYPDSGVAAPMRGYELMVSSEIMRGRYRNSFAHAEAIPPTRSCPSTWICTSRHTRSARGTASWYRCSGGAVRT